MPGSAFIDTNVIIYSLGPKSQKAFIASQLLSQNPVISTQVLSEASNVLTKKFHLEPNQIRRFVSSLQEICRIQLVSSNTIHSAIGIMERYRASWYDSLIIASAIQSGCGILYSEDMHHGLEINNSLKIFNPFKE